MGPNWTQAEGFILGVGAKMFTIAGPVIVYGVSESVLYGAIYWMHLACDASGTSTWETYKNLTGLEKQDIISHINIR